MLMCVLFETVGFFFWWGRGGGGGDSLADRRRSAPLRSSEHVVDVAGTLLLSNVSRAHVVT